MKIKLTVVVLILLFTCTASAYAFDNWQHTSSYNSQPVRYRDWTVGGPQANQPAILAGTRNSSSDVLSIATWQETPGNIVTRVLISSPGNYAPSANEKRQVRIYIDEKPFAYATVALSHGDGSVLFTLQGISYVELFNEFVPGHSVSFVVENHPAPVVMKFSLLGFTDSLKHMAALADRVF
jgi:hypothetical protein